MKKDLKYELTVYIPKLEIHEGEIVGRDKYSVSLKYKKPRVNVWLVQIFLLKDVIFISSVEGTDYIGVVDPRSVYSTIEGSVTLDRGFLKLVTEDGDEYWVNPSFGTAIAEAERILDKRSNRKKKTITISQEIEPEEDIPTKKNIIQKNKSSW